MKKITLLACALLSCTLANAQRTPTHPLDIKDANYSDFSNYFESWEAGKAPMGVSQIDDEFYKSRVRPLPRITDGDYYVDNSVDSQRKLCMWVPLDDPTTQWKALPRYCFEGDNFSLWSYVNIHGNWTAPWIRATAGLTDVAHKNGVKVGTLMSIPWATTVALGWPRTSHDRALAKLVEKDSRDNFKNVTKLVKYMKYYGIDGLGVNSEFYARPEVMSTLIDFFKQCHKEAKKIGWEFQLYWYDGTNPRGRITFDGGLGRHNSAMFGEKDNEVTDMMFANYNWSGSLLDGSVSIAKELNRNTYDYYAGFDIQKNGFWKGEWKDLQTRPFSIGLWGAHSQSLLHQSSTDDGTSDIAIQKAYLLKQELAFSGGYHNPALRPAVGNGTTLSNAALKKFHGLASFLTAKSTIQQVPFVTRFNLGNGLSFRNEGEVTFNHKWYNLGTQDFMPTWRWWITDKEDKVTLANKDALVKAELTFDDAYFGGSCLKLHGQTAFSRVKLFKTMLTVTGTDKLSVIYKVMADKETHAKLFVALKGNVSEYKEIDLPAITTEGQWTTFEAPLSTLGITDESKIAMLGIRVENTPADFDLRIGELAVRHAVDSNKPMTPKIKNYEVIRGHYNTLDFKIRYASKEESGEDKFYNDEVGAWYYEILYQQEGQKEMVITATPSWAAYVVDAPLVNGKTDRKVRFGVRAVAPDGKVKSEISWTNYEEVPYDAPIDNIIMDKAVIKPNETFTMKFEDELHKASKEWKIQNSVTGQLVQSFNNVTTATLQLSEVGNYDLTIVDEQNKETIIRGKIQITPLETGAVPQVESLVSNKQQAKAAEEVSYTYTSKDGEGKVSRGLVIADPNMFQIPAKMQEGKNYSYALWFKADKFAHDKQGTNLINKNTIKDAWPHNNWGDLWVTIRPESQGKTPNEISFNTMGWTEHDKPNSNMITTDYGVTPGVWMHVVVTHTDGNQQKIYINGKKIKEYIFRDSKRRYDVGASDPRVQRQYDADIFIGGGGVYKSGFNGVIDEVQVWNKALTDEQVKEAMKGYTENIPDGLTAYYTFETKNSDGSFPNLGKGGEAPGKLVSLVGSGGEKTETASYQLQNTDNNVTGYPGIIGTLEIKAEHMWTLDGASTQKDNGKSVVVTYTNQGTKGATILVKNQWGEATKTVENLVEITSTTGINGVENEVEFAAYPNPFVESVNLRFAEAGVYTLNVLNVNGTLLQTNTLTTGAGEVTNVNVTGAKGLYLLQVMKNGKTYKTIKLVKK